ncbi:MAG: hypothetical protein AAGG50_01060 [Bacteroidota bacterium]
MLAIVSDLHFQQTDPDSIRYVNEKGEVFQTGVRRNVRVHALDHFFRRVAENAVECEAKLVHIVFAGDIFELHRSPIWFMDKNPQVRPFDPYGSPSLHERVLALLDHLEAEHQPVWKRLRAWVEDRRLDLGKLEKPLAQVEGKVAGKERNFDYVVHYVPGNHDRLANASPEIRRRIRRLLAMPESDAPFPVRLDFTGLQADGSGLPDHQARIRHGHEYDAYNFGHAVEGAQSLDLDAEAYLRPAFGDYVTVEIATRLALAFRAYYGATMRTDTPRGRRLRQVYQDLLEFDDVRPMSALLDYLSERAGVYLTNGYFDDEQTLKVLKRLIIDILEQATRSRFVKENRALLGRWKWLATSGGGATVRKLAQLSPRKLIAWLIDRVASGGEGEAKAGPSAHARYEPELDSKVLLVFGGHTHRPEIVPVAPPDERTGLDEATSAGEAKITETFYVNTGTWRTTIPRGAGRFGRYRALTYAFCYTFREQALLPDRKRFDLWSGAMAQADYQKTVGMAHSRFLAKPYDARADKLGRKTYTLRIEKLKANKVPTDGGAAELRLKLGVDDQKDRHVDWNGVKPESERTLTPEEGTFIVHDSLDGEIRLHGTEDDLVFDDPIPWALYRLPRAGERQNGKVNRFQPGDPFETGSSAFMMHGYGHTQIVVHYTLTENVEPEE